MKFIPALLISMSMVFPAMAQQSSNLSPEEIEALTALQATIEAAGITKPEDIIRLNEQILDAQRAESVVGYSEDQKRVLIDRTIDLPTTANDEPYPTEAVQISNQDFTTISFFGANGEPWPINSFTFHQDRMVVNGTGCGENNAPQSGQGGMGDSENVLTLTACQFWTTGSLKVLLQGSPKPISFNIASGSKEAEFYVDSTVSVVIPSEVPEVFSITDFTIDTGDTQLAGQIETPSAPTIDNSWVDARSRRLNINPTDVADGGVNTIWLAENVTTDVSFIDSNGTAWPIEEVVYNKGLVAVSGDCDRGTGGLGTWTPSNEDGSTFYTTLCSRSGGTISVKLKGKPTALSLAFKVAQPGGNQPDGTLTVVTAGASPIYRPVTADNAASPSTPRLTTGTQLPDAMLDDFLDGAPPQGSRVVTTSSTMPTEAWVYDGGLYIRGEFNVINPAYDAIAQSSGGAVSVYKYAPPVSRLLVQNSYGQESVITIESN